MKAPWNSKVSRAPAPRSLRSRVGKYGEVSEGAQLLILPDRIRDAGPGLGGRG